MRRRVAISVDHTIPATTAATPTCSGRATPQPASTATVAEAAAETSWPITSTCLRFTASDITPAKAPSSSIGMVRAAVTSATAKPDPVTSSVNSAAASTSNQRIALTQPPIAHRRMNDGAASSARTPSPGDSTIRVQSRLLRLACPVEVGRSSAHPLKWRQRNVRRSPGASGPAPRQPI